MGEKKPDLNIMYYLLSLTRRILRNRLGLVFYGMIFIISCSIDKPHEIITAERTLPEIIDYNFHVKPILSDKCFACHGPDAQKQQASLRLDKESSAYARLISGHGSAIVPGEISKSLLVDRILSEDEELMMPPPETNLNLTDTEKATLIKWIEQGAEYKPHWAFIKPKAYVVPMSGSDWAKNEIDHFIANKLDLFDIQPAPEANREQLIRRVFFDLTGLPPTISDLDYWLKNSSSNYFELLVDSLLSLPAYGERMAAHWLDVARFADSEGYLDDYHHTFWPYRDWVINAFNKNLPYDQFISWQIGGDQFPNATQEQKLATAFNRNHKQNSEGGVIPEEFRVEYVVDRTNTLGSAFMALTVGCARCHDHKYDPISQKEYYQLFGYFNSNIERGDGIFSLNGVENGQKVPNEYSMNAGPVLPLLNEETEAIREFLLYQIEDKKESIAQLSSENEDYFKQWRDQKRSQQDLEKVVSAATVTHLTFDAMANGKDVDRAKGAARPTYSGKIVSVDGKFGKAVRSDAEGKYVAEGKRAIFERVDPFTVSFWINTPKVFDNAHVIYNGNNRIQGYRGWDVVLKEGHLHFRLSHAHPYQSLDIKTDFPISIDKWLHFVWTYDGSSQAEGMRLYLNGKEIATVIERNFLYRSTKPFLELEPTIYMPYEGLIIGNRHYDQDFTGGLIDEVRILNKESDDYVAKYLFDPSLATFDFIQSLNRKTSELRLFYNLFIDSKIEKSREKLRLVQNKELVLIDTVQEIMVMEDFTEKRPTHVLERGVYSAKGELVNNDVPNAIFAMPKELPRNRYGLGKWLTHPEHPLTARVAVNQMWYLMFGRGIVETVEDFGNQGAIPTHPELLDWLAIDFQQHGWDLKRLVRQMVLSATYRQSSVIRPKLEKIDPDNKLLTRGSRYRRSAEMIRDNILATSGLLNQTIGGVSTFPYQPEGLWKEADVHDFFPGYEIDFNAGLYRRSIYTFWKRNMPPPNMLIFDASSRAECEVRRQRSNTPLQALVLLNDPQVIEACRSLAENAWKASDYNYSEAINRIFRSLTSRKPNIREMQILNDQYQEELMYFESNPKDVSMFLNIGNKSLELPLSTSNLAALARITNTIVNTTEAYYKN